MSAVTFLLPAHTKSKSMRPFEPFYGTRSATLPTERPRGILDHNTGKFYERSEYTDIEVGSLARWLNDRAEGYNEP